MASTSVVAVDEAVFTKADGASELVAGVGVGIAWPPQEATAAAAITAA